MFNVFPLKNTTFASQFVDCVVHLVKSRWDDDADGLTKWSVVRDGLLRRCKYNNAWTK